jgi:hypothetical protein
MVDQIQQHACTFFRKLWQKLKTKVKPWENIRSAFKALNFISIQQLFLHVAQLN